MLMLLCFTCSFALTWSDANTLTWILLLNAFNCVPIYIYILKASRASVIQLEGHNLSTANNAQHD